MSGPIPALLLSALAAFVLTVLNRFAGEWGIPLPVPKTPPAHAISLTYLALLLASLLTMARAAAHLKVSTALLFVVGLLLAAPMLTVLYIQAIARIPGAIPIWLEISANNLFGPIGAVLVGAGIGRIINHPNTLLAAAGFGAFFDLVVVFLGPVAHLLQSRSPLIQAVSVGAGSVVGQGGLGRVVRVLSLVTIGPADVLFLAVFLSSIVLLNRHEKFRLPTERTTMAWMFGLLMLALVCVQFGVPAVPALAPMGIAVIAANIRHAAFTPREKRDLAIGGLFAMVCAGLIIFAASRSAAKAPQERVRYGFTIGRTFPTRELFVQGIVPDSPAQEGGLKPGDVIERLDGEPTGKIPDEQVFPRIAATAGRGLPLRIRRLGEKQPLDLLLKAD